MRKTLAVLALVVLAGCDVTEPSERATRLRPTVDESDLYNAIVERLGELQGQTNAIGPYDMVVTPTILDETLARLSAQIKATHGVGVRLRLR